MSPRILLAILGIVFVIVWGTLGIGWAIGVLFGALIGYYVGAAIEGVVDVSGLLAPLRRTP